MPALQDPRWHGVDGGSGFGAVALFAPVRNCDTDRSHHHTGDSNHTLHTDSFAQQQGTYHGSDNGFCADDNTVSPVGESFQCLKLEREGQGR